MRLTFCWWHPPQPPLHPPPPLNSLSLLSQLPNVSFDVYCWDFKRTLSTSAGVGFSEQAESSTFLGAKKWIPPHSHPKSRGPFAAPLPGRTCRRPLFPVGLESGWRRVPSSFPSLSKRICLQDSKQLKGGRLTTVY